MCCHPALAPEAQMALTLRLVCGMQTPDIARAFLVSVPAMGALADQALRLTRVLRELMPDEPEIRGLLALLLVTDARRATRVDADDRLLRLAE